MYKRRARILCETHVNICGGARIRGATRDNRSKIPKVERNVLAVCGLCVRLVGNINRTLRISALTNTYIRENTKPIFRWNLLLNSTYRNILYANGQFMERCIEPRTRLFCRCQGECFIGFIWQLGKLNLVFLTFSDLIVCWVSIFNMVQCKF